MRAALVLVFTALLSACASSPREERSARALFAEIAIGAERAHVERLLGKPLEESPERIDQPPNQGRYRACYMQPRPLEPFESPYMLGAIMIVYENDRVVEKVLSPHAP